MKFYWKQFLKVPMLLVFFTMVGIYGLAATGKTAEVNQYAIVTAIGIDTAEDDDVNKYEVSLLTFVPVAEQTFTEKYKIVSAKGRSISEAVDFAGLNIGRKVGLSHLKIIVLSQDILNQGLYNFMDYLTRNVQLSTSTKLVTTMDDSAKDFLAAAQMLDTESSIKISDVITYNADYLYSTDSTLETFFKSTFGPTRVGLMACLTSKDGEGESLSASTEQGEGQKSEGGGQKSGGGGGNGGSGTQLDSQMMIKQCHIAVLKDAKPVIGLDGDQMKCVNFVKGDFSFGSVQVKNFSDEIFDQANLSFEIFDSGTDRFVTYQNGTPVVEINTRLTLRLFEVENKDGMVQKNVDLTVLSDSAINAIEKEVKTQMTNGLNIMRENQVDIADFYTLLHNKNPIKFKKFLENLQDKDDYLNRMVFKISVRIDLK